MKAKVLLADIAVDEKKLYETGRKWKQQKKKKKKKKKN